MLCVLRLLFGLWVLSDRLRIEAKCPIEQASFSACLLRGGHLCWLLLVLLLVGFRGGQGSPELLEQLWSMFPGHIGRQPTYEEPSWPQMSQQIKESHRD